MIGAIQSGWTSANATDVTTIAAQVCQTNARAAIGGTGAGVYGSTCSSGDCGACAAEGGRAHRRELGRSPVQDQRQVGMYSAMELAESAGNPTATVAGPAPGAHPDCAGGG